MGRQRGGLASLARSPGLDYHFWRFNGPRFVELLPAPGRLTVDVGCGEGRLTRQLAELGHRVLGIESSPTLAAAAREVGVEAREADAGCLPINADTADLVIAFMSLVNLDDMDGALPEIARVLVPGGRFCFAVPHPLNSSRLLGARADRASYFERRRFIDPRTAMTARSTPWALIWVPPAARGRRRDRRPGGRGRRRSCESRRPGWHPRR